MWTLPFNRNLVSQFLFKKYIICRGKKKLEIIVYPILITNSEANIFFKNKFFEEWNENKDFENINFVFAVENVEDIDFHKKIFLYLKKSI